MPRIQKLTNQLSNQSNMSENGQIIMGMMNTFTLFVWPVICATFFYKGGYAAGKERTEKESREEMRKTLMTTGCCPYCSHRHFDINRLTNEN